MFNLIKIITQNLGDYMYRLGRIFKKFMKFSFYNF